MSAEGTQAAACAAYMCRRRLLFWLKLLPQEATVQWKGRSPVWTRCARTAVSAGRSADLARAGAITSCCTRLERCVKFFLQKRQTYS
jgi:hypothetical protein